ncbi:MAG: histidine phosphatase family protein [Lachnospiraceae bacterium]|nr:histidine phosphatase family protein [Lachnospiraceae bacterium]
MNIVFIRHAEPDYSIDSLTEKGWREAKLLAERISKWRVKEFYVSPLGRAKATAGCTLDLLGREAVEYPWLREFEGHVVNSATGSDHICWDLMPDHWTKDEGMYDRNNWAKSDIMLTSTNDISKECKTVYDGIDKILAAHGYEREDAYYRVRQHNDDTIVIFCHLGVTLVMLSRILGIAAPVLLHGFFIAPSSVTVLSSEERVEGKAYFRCQVVGDTSHLYAAGEPVSASGYFAPTFSM